MVSDLEALGRVALGGLLGYVIGFEREYRGSDAGDRTFALVCMGSAAFTAIGVAQFPATAEKILAGIVTGIGFLGAGLIMRGDGGGVRGLTTAASLWATAALGVFVGAGELLLAVGLMLLALAILEAQRVPVVGKLLDGGQWRQRRISGDARGGREGRRADD